MMNAVRKFLAKLKFNKSLTIEIVWTAELVFSAILISLLLLGDLWLYKNFVLDKRSANGAGWRSVQKKLFGKLRLSFFHATHKNKARKKTSPKTWFRGSDSLSASDDFASLPSLNTIENVLKKRYIRVIV